MSDVHVQLTPGMQHDFNALVCDKIIGTGIGREVWSSVLLPNSVIKFEGGAGSFQNVIEWQTWLAIKDTEFSKWFAPCEWISPSGGVLIMAKTEQVARNRYPDKLPVFLTDTKFQNYGMLKRRIVCHDYGSHLLLENGMTKRMRAAHWWDAA